jgi:hypothetical protein
MPILDAITQDLDWREGELASMRLLLMRRDLSPLQRETLLRAAWALLYAHYEGFCKTSLTLFYEEISSRDLQCRNLPLATQLQALEKEIKDLKNMTSADALQKIRTFEASHLHKPPVFGDVDTKSNLWPDLLIELLAMADLASDEVEANKRQLKTLVARRNEIAHGRKNFISEVSYYLVYERAVYEVMYDLALGIDSRLRKPPYEHSQAQEMSGLSAQA